LFKHLRLGHLEKSQKDSEISKIVKKKKNQNGYFHLHQFEHEPFWQYLSRLNDYRAQHVHFMYEK